MAFSITGPAELALPPGRSGVVPFTVTNLMGRPVQVRLLSQPVGATDPSWVSVVGDSERPMVVGSTLTAELNITVPMTAPPGTFLTRLVAVPEDDTEAAVQGPALSVTVPPAPVRKRPRWLLPLIIGLAVLLVAGAVTVFFLTRPPKAPVSVTPPSIGGTPPANIGDQLTGSPGTWKGAAVITTSWSRCTSGNCVAIAGATGKSYTVTAADAGTSLRFVAHAWAVKQGQEPSTIKESADFAVSAPKTPVFTPTVPAVSVFRGGGYQALVLKAVQRNNVLVLTIDATGQADLRDPNTSCLNVVAADGTAVATARVSDSRWTVRTPGHYFGDISFSFDQLPKGEYQFLYSCAPDYSPASVGSYG
ncbi:hypothetical protein GCM10009841_13570 [Microlunatus panaciterrae]|uniref:Uncharacterized protein n=1 Tax=Microlunatus panaciterrae TaxID=400768 RepID=A0ABS2RMV3_9ACTN|nr:hypothetical protein [Microlunatus panaciterrae]MBM7799917.1 hypothetical protein [Microlunatus panaciterrae]